MPEVLDSIPPALRPIFERLACPWCRAALAAAPAGLRCTKCPAEFPAREGILDLARRGTAETWGASDALASSQKYQEAYTALDKAEEYNREYEVFPLKRLSTLRERRLIARLLGSQGRVATL